MRVYFLILLVACLTTAVLAFVAQVPHIDRPGYGVLRVRDTDDAGDSHNATSTNATSNATDKGNSTSKITATPTPVPTLDSSMTDGDNETNTTAPGQLPVKPAVTPALGVGGFILLATGTILALIGVKNLWVQVFLSSAFLTSLGVTVLIVYVMDPPVRDAIQGAYLVAIFFTGITFGALAIVFKELAEGLGCLLGGFCVSMWLLSTKSGGLITATDAKAGFIGAISVGFYAVSFSHYTRDYGLIGATSIAGGTAIALGIDCYSKAGLKEFWLYLWALNDDIFPLGTNTYPVTRYMKVELAVVVIVAVMGVISQLRLWKVVRERRLKDEEKRQEEQRKKDEAETEAARRLEEHNMKERMEWEAKYGDNVASSETSTAIPELAAGSQTVCTDDANLKEKDDAGEKKSISDSVVSYRCSECRAQGDCDASTDATGDIDTKNQGDSEGTDRHAGPSPDTEAPGGGLPKCLRNMAAADDRSSGVTAIVGSETVSVYSKRLSMLSKKTSVKSNTKRVSESQEALITRDGDSMSTIGVAEDVNDVDSDCHTIAGDSHYQAMLDEEQPATSTEEPTASKENNKYQPENGESAPNPAKEEVPQLLDSPKPEEPQDKEVASKVCTSNVETHETEQPPVKKNDQDDEVENEKQTQVEVETRHVEDSTKPPATTENDTQKTEQQSDTVKDEAQPQQSETAANQCNENGQATNKPTETDPASESKTKGKAREGLQPDKDSATEPGDGAFAEGGNEHMELEATKKPDETPSSEYFEKKKEEPKRLNAETVEQIPKHTSRVIQAYRMNEWAKHLTDADIPELEPIEPFEDQRRDPAEKEESAAPVKVTELLQTPLNAQPPPPVESRAALGQDTNEGKYPYDSRTGPQTKKRISKSPRRLSGLSVGSLQVLAQDLSPAVQPQLGNIATPSPTTLLPNVAPAEQGYEESEKTRPRWKGPAPLIAVREDMMRNRLSSVSLPTDPYARHSTAQSPPDYSARYPSTFPIAEEDNDDIPLSQRRTMLHQHGSAISPTDTMPTPMRWSNSGVPSRANSPAVLAAWRESVREDLKEKRNPLKLATGGQSVSPTPMGPGDRSSTPFSPLGQRNVSSPSIIIGDKIAEGMQRGDMSELHREAMRRMQAKANKSVNRLTGSKDVIKPFKPVAISGYGPYGPPAADLAIPLNRSEVIGEACARSSGALRLVPRFKSFLVHCPRAPFRPSPANQRRPRPSLFAPSLLALRLHSCQSRPPSVTTASPPSPSLLSSATRPPSPAKTAQSRRFRDLPIISPPQIKEPAPSHPPPRAALQSPQAQSSRTRTAAPPFERLEVETEAPPSRTQSRRLQKRWAAPNILRPPAVRLANPVNYVPRNTPVAAPNPLQASSESLPLESHRDAFPLLTIPERRRSRLTPSPNSLVVERSQQESESGRSSIAVPRGQRQSGTFDDIPLGMEATADRPTHTLGTEVPRHVQSQHSLRSQSQIASVPSNTGAPNEPDVAEELAWGPAHPCFPHINPHVPPGSDEYMTTRIIRIRRDWMVKGDLAPTYSNLYPEILDPLLSEHEFRKIIATVNDELISAFNPYSFRNWIDGAIGLITGWIWEDLGAPAVKGHLRRLEDWLEKWNREVGAKDGVHIWGLRRTGYMSLDIQIPDPKVGIVPSEGNPSRPGTRPDSSGV